jgi:hypothetical protein
MSFEPDLLEEKAHAEFSASGAHRWLSCPGSIDLSKQAPELPESPYALEGTQAHACLEFLLKNRDSWSRSVKALRKQASAEMVEHVVDAALWILDRYKKAPEGAELLIETRVDASPFTCEGQFGTLDAAIVEEFGRLTVIDFKYGAGVPVDPEGEGGRGNPQLVYYALALSHQYGHWFSDVELIVIQPRAYHHSGNTTRSVVLSIDELLAWGPVFKKGVKACKKLFKPLNTGPWCRWCPASVICPKLKEEAFKEAQIVFSDESGVESAPEPRLQTLPNLSVMLDACDKLEHWISKVREHAFYLAERGHKIDGWKIVPRRAQRKWANTEKTADEAWKAFGDKAFSEPELLSPAQLEKVLKGAHMHQWIEERIVRKSSGVTLVKESDKRLPVESVHDVFDVIDIKPIKTKKK